MEQGGINIVNSGGTNITYIKAYPNTNYTLVVSQSSSTNTAIVPVVAWKKTASGFQAQANSVGPHFGWVAYGYSA